MSDIVSTLMELQAQVAQLRGQFEEASGSGGEDALGEVLLRVSEGGPAGGTTLVGNTSDSVPVSGQLKLKSTNNSNIVMRTREESDDESADGTVEIGVYYV